MMQIRLEMHCPADGNPLAFAAGKLARLRVHADSLAAEADGVDHYFIGNAFLFLDLDEAEGITDLPTDEEVPPHGLLLPERLVLVHGLDSQGVRLLHGVGSRVHLGVCDVQLSAGRREHTGEDLHQG